MENYFKFVSGKKGKWIIVALWLVVAAFLNMTFPQAEAEKKDGASNFTDSAPAEQAKQLAKEEFPSFTGVPALLTWYHSEGLNEGDLASIQQLSQILTEKPVSHQKEVAPLHMIPLPALSKQISEDGTTIILPLTFEKGATAEEMDKGLEELKDIIADKFENNPLDAKVDSGNELAARITGPAGIAVDANKLFSSGDLSLLFGTVAIVLVLLLVIYRSPILALIPLIGVSIAYAVISPLLGAIGEQNWVEFDSQSLSIMTVLLFGAGTDYCLFLISRYRAYLEEMEDKQMAMRKALSGSFGAIAMSGLTVVVSLLVLLLAKYGSIHRFGIPFSLSILIMMVASLTLVPALLAILGRFSFYPMVPRTEEMKKQRAVKAGKTYKAKPVKEGLGLKIGTLIIRKPWHVMITTVLVLGFFAFFSAKITYTYDSLSAFPEDLPSREGFTVISEHFSPGELAPVQVMIDTEGKDIPLKENLEKLDYVGSVSEPEAGAKTETLLSYKIDLSSNPYANKAMAQIPKLRSEVTTILEEAGIDDAADKVWIGGPTAEQYDMKEVTASDAALIIPVIVALIAVLLLVYLKSVTATAYLIGTVLLSYFSALGLGWVVLHYGFGVEAIQGLIPLYSFVFIVALGEDYNIFMISSIWKKSKQMPLNQAIKEGVAESGSVITSAGLILAGTFAVLTTLPIQVLVQFGVVTAIGILLDTFIVRPFLVPALTVLFGKWSFWPSKKNMEQVETRAESN